MNRIVFPFRLIRDLQRPRGLTLLAFALGLAWAFPLRAETASPVTTNLWRFEITGDVKLPLLLGKNFNTTSSTPALAPDGTAYLGTFYGTFFAVTPDGREKWRFQAGREIRSSPAVAEDGTLYFGCRDRHLYALTPTGKLKWKFATGAWVDSSPAIAADGSVYFGSWDNSFYALNPDGLLKWKFATGAIVDSSPAIAADGTVYFGSHDFGCYALNPDGTERWRFKTGGEIISSPAIGADGTVYFTSLDGNLYALNPDGTERWRFKTGSILRASPVINGQGDICVASDQQIQVISADGKALWRMGSPMPSDALASPAAVPGRFYVAGHWRSLFAAETGGRWLWKIDLDDKITSSLMLDARGTLYVCAERTLYAIHPAGDLPPDNSPWPMFRANARHTGRVGK